MIPGAICFLGGFLTCLFIHKPEILTNLFGQANIDIGTIDWYVWIAVAAVFLYLLGKRVLEFVRNSEHEIDFSFRKNSNTKTATQAGFETSDDE